MNSQSSEAIHLLGVIRQRAGDGFTLMSESGLEPDKFSEVVKELYRERLVSVSGSLEAGKIGDSYLHVPPSAKQRSDYLIRSGRVAFP